MVDLATRHSAAAEFERCSARAEILGANTAAVRQPLQFATFLLRAQAQLAAAIDESHLHAPLTGHLSDDVDRLIPLHEPLIAVVAKRGPDQLGLKARERRGEATATARTRLLVYWKGDSTAREDYLSRALLRPYVAVLRAHGVAPDRLHEPGHCPFCGGGASISSRKALPDSEAGLRLLTCALCGCEWNFNRICCPSCSEQNPEKLPVYQSDTHAAVRIEACDTCRRYLKSIDLTQDARPIPEIDDLLSLSMDLWATDEAYNRIEPGLAGI